MAGKVSKIQDEAVHTARKLYSTIKQWTTRRRKTISVLKSLAREIDEIHDAATKARAIGTGISTAGSLAMIGSGIATFFTGGLATPLLVASVAGTVAGATTSTVAQVVDASKQSDMIKSANSAVQTDEQLGEKVGKLFTDLQRLCEDELRVTRAADAADNVSALSDRDIEEQQLSIEQFVTGYLYGAISIDSGDTHTRFFLPCENTLSIMESSIGFRNYSSRHRGASGEYIGSKFTSSFVAASVSCIPKAGLKILEEVVGKSLGKSVTKIGVGTGAKFLGNVTILGGGIGLALDIKELIEIATEGKVENSSQLRESASKLKEQLIKMEREFEAVAKVAKLKAELREILENADEISKEEAASILMNILEQTQPSVIEAIKNARLEFDLVSGLLNIYKYFRDYIEEKIQRKRDTKDYDLIIISHGGIKPWACPVPINIIGGGFRKVIFYSPWSCSVDASVVFSIVTGCIDLNNRNFHDCLSMRPLDVYGLPWRWNSIDGNAHRNAQMDEIPYVMLHPLAENDEAYEDFLKLTCECLYMPKMKTRLVVPYIQLHEILPAIPLWLVAVICSLIGTLLNKTFTYHHAACLSKEPPGVWPGHIINKFHNQYCFILYENDVAMTVSNPHPDGPIWRERFQNFEKVVGPLL